MIPIPGVPGAFFVNVFMLLIQAFSSADVYNLPAGQDTGITYCQAFQQCSAPMHPKVRR